MSMYKHLTLAVALTSSLYSACAPSEVAPTADKQSKLGPWIPANAGQFRGGEIAGQTIDGVFYSTNPPTGTPPSPTGWWISVPSTAHYAPVTSISLDGRAYSGLATQQGWLVATSSTEAVLTAQAGHGELTLGIGAPLNAVLRINAAHDNTSYGEYVVDWHGKQDDTWQPYCPHPVLNEDGEVVTQAEQMIPVGGFRWLQNGARTVNSNAIQLSCSHDAVGACATWGYYPWDASLKDAHQSCTRMKRGDFCGVGEAATTTWHNTLENYAITHVQVWDSLGIHDPLGQTTSTVEAFWNTNGAVCFNQNKYRTNDADALQRLTTVISAYCPNIPMCGSKSSGLVASARPCLSYDDTTGNCVAN